MPPERPVAGTRLADLAERGVAAPLVIEHLDVVEQGLHVLTVPEDQILSLHPLATYVGGRKVVAKQGGGV